MSAEPQRTCPSCGNEFSGGMEFCPVCMLRKALADGVESGASSFVEPVKPTSDQPVQRLEHYELVTGSVTKTASSVKSAATAAASFLLAASSYFLTSATYRSRSCGSGAFVCWAKAAKQS